VIEQAEVLAYAILIGDIIVEKFFEGVGRVVVLKRLAADIVLLCSSTIGRWGWLTWRESWSSSRGRYR